MALARLDVGASENTGHCPVFSFAATAAEPATRATPPGHFPATPLRPNTPTRPGRGKGPDRPSHPGPDQLSWARVSCVIESRGDISSSCSRCTPVSCSRA